ncbi:MAG: 4Fe-4S binding protein [Acidobacteriota bacterium]
MSASRLHALVETAQRETRELLSADRELSNEVLKGVAYKRRRQRIEWLRHGVQALLMAVVLGIGWQFVRWVNGLEAGRIVGSRPPGVEGFLPISGLMSLRHLALSGEVSPVHPAALVLLLLILVLSLLVKKAFCSWLCPVGTLSEMLEALGRKIFRRSFSLPRWLDLPLRSLKYLLLAFFVWAIFFRMTPALLAQFLDSPYNRVADIKMLYFFERLSPFAVKFLIGVALLSTVIPYFWCRYLCPYGALLGVLSLLSPFKVTRSAQSCIDCGLCARACPSRLPVDKLRRVRSDECFGCLSCVAACPVTRALQVEAPRGLRMRPVVAAALVLLVFFGGIAAARLTGYWHNNVPDREYLERVPNLDSPEYEHIR